MVIRPWCLGPSAGPFEYLYIKREPGMCICIYICVYMRIYIYMYIRYDMHTVAAVQVVVSTAKVRKVGIVVAVCTAFSVCTACTVCIAGIVSTSFLLGILWV